MPAHLADEEVDRDYRSDGRQGHERCRPPARPARPDQRRQTQQAADQRAQQRGHDGVIAHVAPAEVEQQTQLVGVEQQ